MKKKYIFVCRSIVNIGGAEQYLYNKSQYLEQCGYEVYVFSGLKRSVIIDGLRKYKDSIIPAIMYSPNFFTDNEVKKTLEKMLHIINKRKEDFCCVESEGVATAKWGELLASELACKHLVYNLMEIHDYSGEEMDFLKFKLNNKELAGITKNSVPAMFNNPIKYEDWMTISAYCNNVVEDVEDNFSKLLWQDAALTFGSIGRLEKPFLISVLKALAKYARNNNKKFNILLIGGTQERNVVSHIKSIFQDVPNINLVITGYMYPIPRKLLQSVDLFISTAGAAHVSYFEGRPTINVHPVTGEAVGILGYSYDNKKQTMYDVAIDKTVMDMVRQIIDEKVEISYPTDPYGKYYQDMKEEFDRQLAMAQGGYGTYYDTRSIPNKPSLKYKAYFVLGKLLGGELMQIVLEFARKFAK